MKERKMYYLVEYLYYAEGLLTLNELANKVDSSKRSISDYIDELRQRVGKAGGSLLSYSDGYELNLPDNIGIDYFQHKLMQSSTGLRLLECLFFNDQMTGFELEKKLYVSSSSLSRLITKLKVTLKDYGLYLEVYPYRIRGDEYLIRRFYTTYFIETYGYQAWPFKSIDFNEVNEFTNSMVRFPSLRIDNVNFHEFKVFSAVSLIRESKSYDISQSILSEEITDRKEYIELHDQISIWLDSFSLPPVKKEKYARIYTYSMFYDFRSYTSIDLSCKDEVKRNTITSNLEKVRITFNLPPIDFSHIIDKMILVLRQYSMTSYSKALNNFLLFEPRDYIFLRIYSTHYPLFYRTLNDFLNEACTIYEVDKHKLKIEELLYIVLSRWDQLSLHLYQNYSTCRLLVYSPLSLRHADNMASLLKAKLERSCLVDVFSEPLLTEQTLEKYDFDILVCTSSITLSIDQPIITLHRKFSTYNLRPLLQAIEKIFESNRKKKQRILGESLL